MSHVGGEGVARAGRGDQVGVEPTAPFVCLPFAYGHHAASPPADDRLDIAAQLIEADAAFREIDQVRSVVVMAPRMRRSRHHPSHVAPQHLHETDGRRKGPVVRADIAYSVREESRARGVAGRVVGAGRSLSMVFGIPITKSSYPASMARRWNRSAVLPLDPFPAGVEEIAHVAAPEHFENAPIVVGSQRPARGPEDRPGSHAHRLECLRGNREEIVESVFQDASESEPGAEQRADLVMLVSLRNQAGEARVDHRCGSASVRYYRCGLRPHLERYPQQAGRVGVVDLLQDRVRQSDPVDPPPALRGTGAGA